MPAIPRRRREEGRECRRRECGGTWRESPLDPLVSTVRPGVTGTDPTRVPLGGGQGSGGFRLLHRVSRGSVVFSGFQVV